MRGKSIPACAYCGEPLNRGVKYCSVACMAASFRRSPEECFWRYVKKPDDLFSCWLWTGKRNSAGYGSLTRGNLRAHRVSWELHFGPIPEGLSVLHDCPGGDVRHCVNPAHLWLGTRADNNADKIRKGGQPAGDIHWVRRMPERASRGSAHPHALLTEDQVREIRRRHQPKVRGSRASLAEEFGVSRQAIGDIVNRRRWRHLP